MDNQPCRGERSAVASIILGIISCVFVVFVAIDDTAPIYAYCAIPICALGVLGIILAYISEARGYSGHLRIAGIILSWVGVLSSIAFLAYISGWIGSLLLKLI